MGTRGCGPAGSSLEAAFQTQIHTTTTTNTIQIQTQIYTNMENWQPTATSQMGTWGHCH